MADEVFVNGCPLPLLEAHVHHSWGHAGAKRLVEASMAAMHGECYCESL